MLKNDTANISLKQVINKRISYYKEITLDTKDELYEYNKGMLESYIEMYKDIDMVSKTEFVSKYSNKIYEFSKKMDSNSINQNIDFQTGENNAIVDLLSIINPKYEYFESIENLINDENVN